MFWVGIVGVAIGEPRIPVHIQAPQFVFDQTAQRLTSTGPVLATRQDMTLRGQLMMVDQKKHEVWVSQNVSVTHQKLEINADRVGALDRFERLMALGKVNITFGTMHAQADQGEYFIKRKQVVLSGNPRAWQGQDKLTGRQIILDLKTKKLRSVGGGKVQISAETLAK